MLCLRPQVPSGVIDSVNSFQLSPLRLSADGISVSNLAVDVSAPFAIATGTSSCASPATEAGCLTGDFAAQVERRQELTVIRASLKSQGAWTDPLNFSNFAVVDPSFAVGLELAASCEGADCISGLNVSGAPQVCKRNVCYRLTELQWSPLTLYYKQGAGWPAASWEGDGGVPRWLIQGMACQAYLHSGRRKIVGALGVQLHAT